MFDEKNNKWLELYKVVVGIGTFCFLILGLVLCIIWGDSYSLDDYAWMPFVFGIVLAFANQVSGMLIANVIGNIQRIRECAEHSLRTNRTKGNISVSKEEKPELPEL